MVFVSSSEIINLIFILSFCLFYSSYIISLVNHATHIQSEYLAFCISHIIKKDIPNNHEDNNTKRLYGDDLFV